MFIENGVRVSYKTRPATHDLRTGFETATKPTYGGRVTETSRTRVQSGV